MFRTLSPAARLLVGLGLSVGAVLAIKLVVDANGYHFTNLGRVGMILAWSVLAAWIMPRYWRGIDEAAQEAQKWAWFWGGSFGMGVGLIAVSWDLAGLSALVPADASRKDLMTYGAGVVLLTQGVGFFGAWVAWWWSRR